MPVIALVSPQPWCTVTAASRPRDPRVGVGHRRRTALVPRGDEPGARGDHRVGDVEVARADDAEDVVDPGRRPGPGRRRPRRPSAPSALDQRQHARRGAGAGDDRQRPDDERPRRWAAASARFCSWVRPYLPLPIRNEWHGNGGSNEWAAPASVPTVSTPTPIDRRLLGDPAGALGAHARRVRAGLVGVDEPLLAVGPGVPAGAVEQPAAVGQRRRAPPPTRWMSSTSSRKSGFSRAPAAEVEHHRRAGSAGRPGRSATSLPSLPGDPVVGRVEVGAGVLAAAEVVPVPRRPAVVVPADLLELEALRSGRTPAAAG